MPPAAAPLAVLVVPDDPVQIRWTFADPGAAPGTEAERSAVFRRIRDAIQHRVRLFVNAQVRPRG